FVPGMGYVALSRVRTLSGMRLLGFNQTALRVHPEVLVYDIQLQELSDEAVGELSRMGKSEIEKKQREFIDNVAEKVDTDEKDTRTAAEKTFDMVLEKMSLEEMADARGVKQETIVSHLEQLIEDGNEIDIDYLQKEFKHGELDSILEAIDEVGPTPLVPIYNYLTKKKKKTGYLKIRL